MNAVYVNASAQKYFCCIFRQAAVLKVIGEGVTI